SFWDGGLGARIASGLGGGAPGNIGASLFIGGSIAKAQGGKFIDGVKGAAIGMGIAYGIGRIAQAVKDPPDSTSIELSKKNFSSDEIADIESRLKTAQEDLIGKSFGGGEAGTMAAALALDQNQALTSIANDYGIEPWGVIGGENNTILSVGTGFSSSRSFGSVTSLVANDGHTIWHRHPSGSGLWSGDFHTAANSRAKYNVFASGNNVLEGWFVNRSAYKSGAPLQVQRYRNGAWSQVEFN
ncbi:MAG: hypothetical protein M0Q95_20800, partial [Porticoccaceae bacterium]|nr:hypothetical protein [Porticoccaceae bacterium]